jgi:hypothetical protein
MNLSLGALCLSVGMLLFAIAVLGGRNPVQPRWAGEMMMSCIIAPMIVGLLAIGAAYLIQSLLSGVWPSLNDLGFASAIVAVSYVIYASMGFRRKLQGYEIAEKAAQIISVDFKAPGDDGQAQPPFSPTSGFRKAA